MSKAILILDMPNKCVECPLFVHKDIEGDYECKIKDYDGLPIYYKEGNIDRPDWCPLRELLDVPDIKNIPYEADYYSYMRGWSDCIDKIFSK